MGAAGRESPAALGAEDGAARPRGSPEAAQLSRLVVLPERSRDIEES